MFGFNYFVSYFRANKWHVRLFVIREHALVYADTFPLMTPGSFKHNIPGY